MDSILVVDDDPDTLEVIRRNLEAAGYAVSTAPSVDEALRHLRGHPVHLVVTDYKMPKSSGLDLVRHVRENLKDTEVVMITGHASVEGAVAAVKSGAEEYLAKPFTEDELLGAVKRALDKLKRRRAGMAAPSPKPREMAGKSEAMQAVFATMATTPATVLVTGESGTGKELAARAVHYASLRANAPFVAVACGGVSEGLLESELFGHVRGAFTGAVDDRRGVFELADGGTVYLDDVADTSGAIQSKLLRVLQDKEVAPAGGVRAKKVDIRVIAATRQDLGALVKKKAFREDLFFRLNVIAIALPPLRERGDDVLLLARHFANRYATELGKAAPAFTDAALAAMRAYYWPGNVRELENVVQRALVMTDGASIDVTDLPPVLRFTAGGAGVMRKLEEVEGEHIRAVLASVQGNKSKAAEVLGIDRKTLREKLKRMGLE